MERKIEDTEEAISTNYFTLGFLMGWLTKACSDLEVRKSSKKSGKK